MFSNFLLAKSSFYLGGAARLLRPPFICRQRLPALLRESEQRADSKHIETRVQYYNKLTDPFVCTGPKIQDYRSFKRSAYAFDIRRYLPYFSNENSFSYVFGDTRDVPPEPSFVKARPIDGDNRNSVLLKLNTVRHFQFSNDKTPFRAKKNVLVWRGAVHAEPRIQFMKVCSQKNYCDIRPSNMTTSAATREIVHIKPHWMSVRQQLEHKFVLSIEGNDVASNLKWILSSQSLCFMCRPRFETWFMEGTLRPGEHYVEIKPDFSNIEEQIEHYLRCPQEAEQIVRNANSFCAQFFDERREKLISLRVMQKYFELSRASE
jgi:hypothetical protein